MIVLTSRKSQLTFGKVFRGAFFNDLSVKSGEFLVAFLAAVVRKDNWRKLPLWFWTQRQISHVVNDHRTSKEPNYKQKIYTTVQVIGPLISKIDISFVTLFRLGW